jgi:hypothetical protein
MSTGDKELLLVALALAFVYSVVQSLGGSVTTTPGLSATSGGAWDGSPVPTQPGIAPPASAWGYGSSSPWDWPVQGFPPGYPWYPQPAPINVDVYGSYPGTLANSYFPLFGFVGVDTYQAFQ